MCTIFLVDKWKEHTRIGFTQNNWKIIIILFPMLTIPREIKCKRNIKKYVWQLQRKTKSYYYYTPVHIPTLFFLAIPVEWFNVVSMYMFTKGWAPTWTKPCT